MSVECQPSRVGLGLTAGAGLLAAAGTLLAGGVALAGVALAVAGVYRCSRKILVSGVGALFVGVVLASVSGVPPGLTLVGMAGTVLAWDVGENAISVAEQLRTASTGRLEAVHATVSTLVVSGVGVGGYVVFYLADGGYPALALALVVAGAVVVLATVR